MNIFNIFPEEIWINILMYVPCYKLTEMSTFSGQFQDIIEKDNLIERKKYKEYPRKSGSCKTHNIYDLDEVKKLNISVEDGINIDELHEILTPLLPQLLIKLYDLNYDLVRGDLICFSENKYKLNYGVYIFDGAEIINLDTSNPEDLFESGLLPYGFTTIINDVPLHIGNIICHIVIMFGLIKLLSKK